MFAGDDSPAYGGSFDFDGDGDGFEQFCLEQGIKPWEADAPLMNYYYGDYLDPYGDGAGGVRASPATGQNKTGVSKGAHAKRKKNKSKAKAKKQLKTAAGESGEATAGTSATTGANDGAKAKTTIIVLNEDALAKAAKGNDAQSKASTEKPKTSEADKGAK